jgi:D-alanine-D-alanine ligase
LVVTGGWGPEREENLVGAAWLTDCLVHNGWTIRRWDVRKPADLGALAGDELRAAFAFLCHTEDLPTPLVLDAIGMRHSAPAPWTSIATSYDKPLTYAIARSIEVPTPRYRVITRRTTGDPLGPHPLPLVVKPTRCGSSLGVGLAEDVASLRSAIRAALRFDSAALVEEFLDGQEYTVAAIGQQAVSILNVDSASGPLCGYAEKQGLRLRYLPTTLEDDIQVLREWTRRLAEAFDVEGFWRADYRFGRGHIRLLDMNLLPFLGWIDGGLVDAILSNAGWTYYEFLNMLAAPASG